MFKSVEVVPCIWCHKIMLEIMLLSFFSIFFFFVFSGGRKWFGSCFSLMQQQQQQQHYYCFAFYSLFLVTRKVLATVSYLNYKLLHCWIKFSIAWTKKSKNKKRWLAVGTNIRQQRIKTSIQRDQDPRHVGINKRKSRDR